MAGGLPRRLLSFAILLLSCALSAAGRLFPMIQLGFRASNYLFVNNNGAFLSSPNDTFRAAIYNPLSQQSRFYFCVLHVPSYSIVWAANRNFPISKSGNFSLTAAGIVVVDDDGALAWSTPPLSAPASSLRVTDQGNLVLFDASNRSIWESFGDPTDTIVVGQRIRVGSGLTSSASLSDLSPGEYSFNVSDDDIGLRWRIRQQYWSLSTDPRGFRDSNAIISYLELNDSGISLHASAGDSAVWKVGLPVTTNFRSAILESNGRFVVRSFSGGVWKEEFAAPTDYCVLPLSCGRVGLCSGSTCGCPQGFRSASGSPATGCLPNDGSVYPSPQCNNRAPESSMSYSGLGSGTQYFASKFLTRTPSGSSLTSCQNLCSGNCSCLAFFFSSSSSSCYLLTDELGSLFYSNIDDTDSMGYIKTIPSSNPGSGFINESSQRKVPTAVLVVLPCIGAIMLIILAITLFLWWGRSRNSKNMVVKLGRPVSCLSGDIEMEYIQIPGMPRRFKYEELETATDNFSTQIGVGGFGEVYKGTLQDKSLVAVKKFNSLGVQGKKEFLTEIATIGSIRHVNLVKLGGFCAQGSQRILVYEYMNRGSLDRSLFGTGPVLEWQERLEIALGTARGLAYLHGGCEHKIVHCDIKPENILLHDWQVKISDFGLAKLLSPEQSNIFTTMRGTRGYLAPEWLTNAAISDKTDVYSYGMVLLELIRGRKNCSIQGGSRSTNSGSDDGYYSGYFPLVALEMYEQKRYIEVADPRLEGRVTSEEVEKLVRVALCCVHEEPTLRPSMANVVAMLEGGIPVVQPRVQSLNFLRFYGRRFIESDGTEGLGESNNQALCFRPDLASSSSTTSGDPSSISYLSSQQISGPR